LLTTDFDRVIQNIDRLGWIFQQDRAHAHMSQLVLDWLEESITVIVDWSANSGELSPIELLWAILKKLVERISSQTIGELGSALLKALALIHQNSINKLCRAFLARLELCL
jgi:hypothetical protein